ncbi:MAG TPA: class I SAM-dependent methyltransferase [Candidatus Hydrogenedentes bacterium]|nr:class I SAM-dependent methyltransferase [Candidatus Hydrogenedentota bacterium]HOL76317.1 class I SAM-dependent methyltransferase [Candidatus Hydrogenedentota bacterium]HPO86145.1 class I SAM-dependent methyltransferase [Candidatus Hydrogenedentota bacterium]
MLEKAATYYDSPEMTQHIACSSLARTGRLRFAISQEESGKTILDLGCGPGTQISYLAPRNFVVGTDAGFRMLQQARSAGLAPCRADFEQPFLPFREDSFDIVVCTDVIEHVRYPLHLLKEIHRILKPDGAAILSVPNQYNVEHRLKILFGGNILARWDHKDFHAWDYFHLHFWTWRDFQDFVRVGGFEITDTYHEQVPIEVLQLLRLLTQPDYLADWHRRHRKEKLYRLVVTLVSAGLRLTRLGKFLPTYLPKWFPSLFTESHIARVVKSNKSSF